MILQDFFINKINRSLKKKKIEPSSPLLFPLVRPFLCTQQQQQIDREGTSKMRRRRIKQRASNHNKRPSTDVPWSDVSTYLPQCILFLVGFLIIAGLLALALVVGLHDPCPCSTIVAYNATVSNATSGVPIVPTTPLVLAILADQGLSSRAKAVLQLVRDRNASVVMHQGDFDYKQGPKCWTKQIFSRLANETDPDRLVVDYFAAYGNHDLERGRWPLRGYSLRLRDQLHPAASQCCCEGRVGARATCVWENVVMLQIGAGTTECYTQGSAAWITGELARLSDYPWKFCMFHLTREPMQLGYSGTKNIGWDIYEACREGGAIILTGHDHRYARTHLMSSFGPTQVVNDTSSTLQVSPGLSFVAISGLGGYSIRRARASLLANPWWAASLNKGDPLAGFGALFIEIGSANVSGDPRQASAYFMTTNGDVIDPFTIQV